MYQSDELDIAKDKAWQALVSTKEIQALSEKEQKSVEFAFKIGFRSGIICGVASTIKDSLPSAIESVCTTLKEA